MICEVAGYTEWSVALSGDRDVVQALAERVTRQVSAFSFASDFD